MVALPAKMGGSLSSNGVRRDVFAEAGMPGLRCGRPRAQQAESEGYDKFVHLENDLKIFRTTRFFYKMVGTNACLMRKACA